MTDCSDRLPKDYLKMVMIPNHNKFHQQKPVSKNPKLLDSIRRVLKSANHQDFSIKIDKKSNYWNEIKTSGMNLSPRSYHSMDYYNGYIYVYGGYDFEKGILSDFCRMIWKSGYKNYIWEKIIPNNEGPKELCCHNSFIYNDKLYIFGGKTHTVEASNKLFNYDFFSNNWSEISNDQTWPKPVDSFSLCLKNNSFIIFGGFNPESGDYNNDLFEFNLQTNKWIELKANSYYMPFPRANHKSIFHENQFIVFGGQNKGVKFNDLWIFNLEKNRWNEIKTNLLEWPISRSNHSLVLYEDNLILFAGSRTHTFEKNDLFIFSLKNKTWKLIEDDSLIQIPPQNLQEKKSPFRETGSISSSTKKPDLTNIISKLHSNSYLSKHSKISLSLSPRKIKAKIAQNEIISRPKTDSFDIKASASLKIINSARTALKSDRSERSLSKNKSVSMILSMEASRSKIASKFKNNHQVKNSNLSINEVQRRIFETKKKNLLSQFDIFDEKLRKELLVLNSPTTDKLRQIIAYIAINRNTKILNEIEEPNSSKKGIRQKLTSIKFNRKTPILAGKIKGVRPCAREGHACIVVGKKMIIYGGNRLTMTFNDFFEFNLDNLAKE